MPTPFDALVAGMETVLDAQFAEALTFRPMRKPANGRAVPDPDRPVREVKGVLDWTARRTNLDIVQSEKDIGPFSGRAPLLSLLRSQFASLDQEPRQGDRFEAAGRPGAPVFEVEAVERDGLSRLVCRLVQLGGQT